MAFIISAIKWRQLSEKEEGNFKVGQKLRGVSHFFAPVLSKRSDDKWTSAGFSRALILCAPGEMNKSIPISPSVEKDREKLSQIPSVGSNFHVTKAFESGHTEC